MILGELYRRDGAWCFRAVGQGYSGGPAALAADHGIPAGALPTAPVSGPAMTEVHKEAAAPSGTRTGPSPRPGTAPAGPGGDRGPEDAPAAGPEPWVARTASPAPSLVKAVDPHTSGAERGRRPAAEVAHAPQPAPGPAPKALPAPEAYDPNDVRAYDPECVRSSAGGVHEGRGTQELTVHNPEPGRTAVVEFERRGGPGPRGPLYLWRLDGSGAVDELCAFSTTRDARGGGTAVHRGRAGGAAEGRVLRRLTAPGPGPCDRHAGGPRQTCRGAWPGRTALRGPALLRATCDGREDISGYAHTVQPDGTRHRVGQIGTRMPMTGPAAVGPEGWCHVIVKLDHAASRALKVRR
ncbi:TerD family protein [Streptomyces sp. NPDC093089]|uniref:TerD family protein n=1 Tax=Streptomyces sp. NPDC093089 TaxID=3366024 RepID=UPI0037FC40E0